MEDTNVRVTPWVRMPGSPAEPIARSWQVGALGGPAQVPRARVTEAPVCARGPRDRPGNRAPGALSRRLVRAQRLTLSLPTSGSPSLGHWCPDAAPGKGTVT